jgi:hypothetical protein
MEHRGGVGSLMGASLWSLSGSTTSRKLIGRLFTGGILLGIQGEGGHRSWMWVWGMVGALVGMVVGMLGTLGGGVLGWVIGLIMGG